MKGKVVFGSISLEPKEINGKSPLLKNSNIKSVRLYDCRTSGPYLTENTRKNGRERSSKSNHASKDKDFRCTG